MSRQGETNPHFWPRQPPPQFTDDDFVIEPTSRIQRRSRPDRPRPPPPPPPAVAVGPTADSSERPQQPPPPVQPPLPRRDQTPPPARQPRPHPVVVPPLQPPQQPPAPPHQSTSDHGFPPLHRTNLIYPSPDRTKPITWFGAVFCCILWLVIILGGLLVLAIYLIYRPRSPHFEVSSVTLNAAYLDMGYLLNSDLTVLANFTNPNKKVNIDFSYVTLQLYFEKHLIANQYIEPFSAMSSQSELRNVEMVTSQVRLPMWVTERLVREIENNRVVFEVDGFFHARSRFGTLFRYSYWLYGHCTIVMSGPPSGIMIARKCTTKT